MLASLTVNLHLKKTNKKAINEVNNNYAGLIVQLMIICKKAITYAIKIYSEMIDYIMIFLIQQNYNSSIFKT